MMESGFKVGDTITLKIVSKKEYLKDIQTEDSETYFGQKRLIGETYNPKNYELPIGLMIVRPKGCDDYYEDGGIYFKVVNKE